MLEVKVEADTSAMLHASAVRLLVEGGVIWQSKDRPLLSCFYCPLQKRSFPATLMPCLRLWGACRLWAVYD